MLINECVGKGKKFVGKVKKFLGKVLMGKVKMTFAHELYDLAH